jgi:hypothetical protein
VTRVGDHDSVPPRTDPHNAPPATLRHSLQHPLAWRSGPTTTCSRHTSRTQDHRNLTTPTAATTGGDYLGKESGFSADTSTATTQRGDHGIHVGLDACNLTPVAIDIIAQILNEPN